MAEAAAPLPPERRPLVVLGPPAAGLAPMLRVAVDAGCEVLSADRDAGGAAAVLSAMVAGSLAGRPLMLVDGLADNDLLTLLEAVDDAMGDARATLWLVDRFAARRQEGSAPGLLLLRHALEILERMGWRALPADGLEAPSSNLSDSSTFSAFSAVAEARLALPAGGDDDTAVVGRFNMARPARPRQRLVAVDERKSNLMRELFEQVFGHAMSDELWRWKYAEGRGRAVGVIEAGRLVAHYGGLTRRLLFHGRAVLGCQVGDVMVLPSARSSLARGGVMHQTGSTFAVLQLGHGAPHLLGFGFPNGRAFAVAQRLGMYQAVDEVVSMSWPAASSDLPLPSRLEAIDGDRLTRTQRRAVDELWARMAPALAQQIVGVRDADWIEYRYLRRPGLRYSVLLVRSRWWRRPIGLLVLRQQEQVLNVLDMVGAPAHFELLVRVARAQARSCGAARVACWITRSQLHRLHRVDADPEREPPPDPLRDEPRVEALDIQVPSTVQTEGPSLAALKDHWFLLQGDADFT